MVPVVLGLAGVIRMFVPRMQSDSIMNISNGCFFRFADSKDRNIYVMINNHEGTYRHRGRPKEVLTLSASDFSGKYRVKAIEMIEMPELTPECQVAFDAVVAKAKEIGRPTHYLDDLFVHDRRILAVNQPKVFGWSVRDTGTHTMIPDNVYSLFLTSYLPRCVETRIPSMEFLWNGRNLVPSDPQRIQDALLNWSCETTRKFARLPWHDKNNSNVSGEWQKMIDREIQMNAHKREHERKIASVVVG